MNELIQLSDGLIKLGVIFGGMTLIKYLCIWKMERNYQNWEKEFEKNIKNIH